MTRRIQDDQPERVGRRWAASVLRAGWFGRGDERLSAPRPAEWTLLGDYAARCGLAGLVQQSARKLGWAVPPAAEAVLHEAATQTALRNLQVFTRCESVFAALRQARVEALALKGAALVPTVYRRYDLRPMSDIDLLVHTADAEQAGRALHAAGCGRGDPLVRADFFPRYYYEAEFRTADELQVKFDLHVRPFRPAYYRERIREADLWSGWRRAELGRTEIGVPSGERLLVHLCAHAAFHGQARLLWLVDVGSLLQAQGAGLDWAEALRITREWGLVAAVRETLTRTEAEFGPLLPAPVRLDLANLASGWRQRLVLRQAPRDATHPLGRLLVDLLAGGGWRTAPGYLWALICPQRAHMADIYPHRHWGWLACAHAWRWTRALVRPVRGRVRGGRSTRAAGA